MLNFFIKKIITRREIFKIVSVVSITYKFLDLKEGKSKSISFFDDSSRLVE